jgi:hypothetical protein
MCANRLHSPRQVKEALLHELIHSYDYVVRDMDITQGRLLACSEVRSAREAECFEKTLALCESSSLLRGLCDKWTRRCVRQTADRATSSMFPEGGRGYVGEMFEECYQDRSPFQEEGER